MRDPHRDRPRRVVLALTPAQLALLESEPDVARRAVIWVFYVYGRILPEAQAIDAAGEAVSRAAQSFNAAKGSFGDWAFWRACHAIVDAANVEHRHAELLATMRVFYFSKRAEGRRDGVDPSEPAEPTLAAFEALERSVPERLAKVANTWADEMVGATWAHSEEARIEREDAARNAKALRQVLRELSPWQRRVLALEFHDKMTLEEVAKSVNMHYRKLLVEHTELKALMRARLSRLGVRSIPCGFADEAAGILEELGKEDGG